jgi:hypothetical protein
LLSILEIDITGLESSGTNDPPDCTFYAEGKKFGVEVVALMDERARRLNAKARRQHRPEYYADWTAQTFKTAICDIVANKDKKIEQGKLEGKGAAKCDLLWLAIHADETALYSSNVESFLQGFILYSDIFEKIYLVLSYEPGTPKGRYPYFVLN